MKKFLAVVLVMLFISILGVAALSAAELKEKEGSVLLAGVTEEKKRIPLAPEGEAKRQFPIFVTLDFNWSSDYVDRLSGESLASGSVYKVGFLIFHQSGLYVGGENYYVPKRNSNPDSGDKSVFVGYEREFGQWKMDAGYSFMRSYVSEKIYGELHRVYATVTAPEVLKDLRPYVSVAVDAPVNKKTLEGGVVYRGGFKYKKGIFGQVVLADLSVAGNNGPYGYRAEPLSSGKAEIAVPIKINKILEVRPEASFQQRFGYARSNGGMSQSKIWGGVTVSISFG